VPGSTVIDAGAHIGSLTVPIARFVGPSGQVYAFEPQRKVHRELVHNVRLNNLTNVKTLRLALGADFGVVEMNPVKKADGQKKADGTIRIGEGGDKVELRPLDSFDLENVSVMKIDVEGYQAEVLKGATKTIRRWKPVLIIEIQKEAREETFKLLEEFSYTWTQRGANYVAVPSGEPPR
jgi:FkbM family methyltransferase